MVTDYIAPMEEQNEKNNKEDESLKRSLKEKIEAFANAFPAEVKPILKRKKVVIEIKH